MLNKAKTRALLAPAFTDPKLARLLMLAIAQAAIDAEAKETKSIMRDYDDLFEVAEQLRAEQAPPRE